MSQMIIRGGCLADIDEVATSLFIVYIIVLSGILEPREPITFWKNEFKK